MKHKDKFLSERGIQQYMGLIKNNFRMIESNKHKDTPQDRKLFYQVSIYIKTNNKLFIKINRIINWNINQFMPNGNWTSLFPFSGLLGGILHFYSNFNTPFCKQIVEIMIRCHGRMSDLGLLGLPMSHKKDAQLIKNMG